MTTAATPTVESHPYQVGRVVYPTLTDASIARERALEIYPGQIVKVIDRRTNEVVVA